MIQLDLNEKEVNLLIEVLEHDLSEIRMEIADTDSMDFRDTLKAKKDVLSKLIAALKGGSASANAVSS